MLSSRIAPTILTTVGDYAVTFARKDEVTFAVQIFDTRDGEILVDLPLDPMDNTLAGTISVEAMKKLGSDAQAVLGALSKSLQEQIGAKEFILIPAGFAIPEFVPVHEHSFKRMRQANRKNIKQHADTMLNQHAELVAMLDQQYHFIVGANNLRETIFKCEQRVFDFFIEHANFTKEKMEEYQAEGTEGVKSRLNNTSVTVIAMLDKQHNLCGMLRSLAMGGEVGYLSDEVMNQNVISLDKFSGATKQEKEQNRGAFLLAYFANRAVSLIEQQEEFVIIAAAGRESIYEAIGFQSFPSHSNDHSLFIKLGAPGHLLKDIKKQLMIQPLLGRPPIELEIASALEQNNGSQLNPSQLDELPSELLLEINRRVPSVKETARLASVSKYFHRLFQPEIEKTAAKQSAEYAIYPTNENVEEFKKLLSKCPALLSHPVTVKNRHGMEIQGTVYQIALHEGDNELIEDVIRPAFAGLPNGLAMMEAQRQKWLHEGWMDAEEKICRSAYEAIDQLFTVFISASNPNDVTELPEFPHTITINHQGAREVLEACKKSIAALYQPTAKIISGRDPIIRLIERVIDRCKENHEALGGYCSPRNSAVMRMVFGYCQRFAPINFMQAFAMGIYFIVEYKEKLIRSFEYRNLRGHFILPLDSGPLPRLGYEYFASSVGVDGMGWDGGWSTKLFVGQKQQHLYDLALCSYGKGIAE